MIMQTRRLSLAPTSFNRAAGTVQATISTGASVQRSGYVERLAVTPDAVDVSPHLPVLDAHRQGSIADVLGRVTDVTFSGGTMAATLRVSSPAALDAIERGDLSGVSIGYRVATWSDDRAGGVLTRTATKWALLEVSLVPLPADAGATLRSQHNMSETNVETTPEQTAAVERADLNRSIRSVATATALGTTWADQQIDAGATVEQARAAALDELIRRGGGTIRTQRAEIGTDHTDPAAIVTRMGEALTARMAPGQKPSDAARPYLNLSVVDMARQLLQARGERVQFLSREDVIKRAMHTTSDFPNLLTGSGNRVLSAAYEAAPNPLKLIARQTTLPDFRAKSVLRLGEFGQLLPVTEHGEIKATTRAETKEGYSLTTFARLFSISRQALINDDLGAFADWNAAMGRAAAETEAQQLAALLITNPVMQQDGKRLFSTDHGNLGGTGGNPDVAGLTIARSAMRTQVGVDGKTPINATPKYLVVSPNLETMAEQLLATIAAATTDTSNPFSGKLTLLVEPRLPPGAWYVFADPASLTVLEFAYLTSAPGPQLASREGWDVLGMEFRCVLDFGCGAIDWRGAFKNPSA